MTSKDRIEQLEQRLTERTEALRLANEELRRNVLERKRAEAELVHRWKEIHHMGRVHTVSTLASSLAHELNQPLAGILSGAQAAQRFLAGTEPDVSQALEILADIVEDDKRAAGIIRRLLAFLRKEESIREPMDINGAVRDALRIAAVRDTPLLAKLSEGLPRVRADRIEIEQVVINLIMNAEQAMGDIPPAERKIVVSTALDAPDSVVVSVRDTGPGIAQAMMSNVFEPFHSTKPQGLGMGLAICRSIVMAHGGRIWLENNPAGGAMACVKLPVEEG